MNYLYIVVRAITWWKKKMREGVPKENPIFPHVEIRKIRVLPEAFFWTQFTNFLRIPCVIKMRSLSQWVWYAK